jgi:hypothetical protein
MLTTAALASLLLSAQPAAAPAAPVAPDQAALASCLGRFVAAEQQAGRSPEDMTSAFANTCLDEERAYRKSYVAAATARGAPFLDADSQAYSNALDLRVAQRSAFLTANMGCGRPERR